MSSLPSEPNADVDESVEEVGKEKTLDILKEQQENRNIFQKMGDFITGAGSERKNRYIVWRLEKRRGIIKVVWFQSCSQKVSG